MAPFEGIPPADPTHYWNLPAVLAAGNPYADIARHFDKMASQYRDGCQKVGWCGQTRVFNALQQEIAQRPGFQATKLLDLGAGTGELGKLFKDAHAGIHVTGVDLSAQMLALGIQDGHIDATHTGSVTDLSAFEDASFDVTTCSGVLDFVANTGPFAQEVARVTRPGGLFAFTYEPYGTSRPGVKSYQHVTAALVAQFRQAGAEILSVERVSPVFTNFRTGAPVTNNVMLGTVLAR